MNAKEKLFKIVDRIEELKKIPSDLISESEELELRNLEVIKMQQWFEWKDQRNFGYKVEQTYLQRSAATQLDAGLEVNELNSFIDYLTKCRDYIVDFNSKSVPEKKESQHRC